MDKSFRAFTSGVFKRLYWLLLPLLSYPFEIAERWFGMNFDTPQWLFWILLMAGLYIAAFRTYDDVKRKLDDIGEEFFFEPTGMSVTTKTGDVLIGATFRAKPSVIVDELHLEIEGIPLPFTPSKWTPFSVSPQYTNTWTFELGETNKGKTHIGKLIAKVGKKEHESREFPVYA